MPVMRRFLVAVLVAGLTGVLVGACSDSDSGLVSTSPDSRNDREVFFDEVDDVRASVADCFVSETSDDGRRYRTTVEVVNSSSTAHAIVVTIEADFGRGGVSDAIEVPAGGSDAWAVVADEETTDPIGDVECGEYIVGMEVTLSP